MAEQDRAIRTRRTILMAAAKVFEERGFQAATISEILAESGVTKGALYFHFQSKEDLAQEVFNAQDNRIMVPDRQSKVQQVVDVLKLHAYRLQTDPVVRASVRLAMDFQPGFDRSAPWRMWTEIGSALFTQAKAQGELFPHVDPFETTDVLVAAFSGVQSMSDAVSGYEDLQSRASALLRHILPNVVLPSVLAHLDLSDERGAAVYAEALRAMEEQPA